MKKVVYTGEIIRAEEGTEDTYYCDDIRELIGILRSLKTAGDALTINVDVQDFAGVVL